MVKDIFNGGLAKQEDFGGEDPITPPPPKK